MEPLHIEWQIANAWSPPNRGLHLDGLVARAIVEQQIQLGETLHADYQDLIKELPFEKYEGDHGWCWKASIVEPRGRTGMGRRYLTGKTPETEMAIAIVEGRLKAKGGGASIDTVRGSFKNAALTYPLEYITGLEAWCIGDPERLVPLLSAFSGLGVKNVRGHGTVVPFEDGSFVKISSAEEARTRWMRRNLPDKLLDDDACYPAQLSLRSPYWINQDVGWAPVL